MMLRKRYVLHLFIFIGLITASCSKHTEAPSPTISSINPDNGPYGTIDTINGSGFSFISANNQVKFNGIPAIILQSGTSRIIAKVPKGAGSGTVQIMVNDKTVTGLVFNYRFVVVVSTLAGSGLFGSEDGRGSSATFNHPRGITVSGSGNLFVCDEGSNKIRQVTPDGNVTTIAGNGTAGYFDGIDTTAELNGPVAVNWIPANTLFPGDSDYLLVADSKNNLLRSVNLLSHEVKTWAGSTAGYADGSLTDAQFNFPAGLAFYEPANFLFISDYLNNRIRICGNNYIGTLAGNSTIGLIDGTGTNASFAGPAGMTVDDQGNVYVADWYNNAIRKIDRYQQVTTIAGTGSEGYNDGSGTTAQFNTPSDVALYHGDQLLVADGFNHRIRLINLNDNSVSTLAGSGKAGFQDGKDTVARFNGPAGIVVSDSIIYVSDYFNNRIRKITME